jgi:hypothetical protein
MWDAIIIINTIAILTNTTVLLVMFYKIGVKVFKHENKRF